MWQRMLYSEPVPSVSWLIDLFIGVLFPLLREQVQANDSFKDGTEILLVNLLCQICLYKQYAALLGYRQPISRDVARRQVVGPSSLL
jgi:hypothetical protein